MNKTLSQAWFDGGRPHKDVGRPQSIEGTLAKIALTAVDPTHSERFTRSCHHHAAMAIRKFIKESSIRPDDEIILLGLGDRVYHTIIVRDGKPIVDSLQSGSTNITYDHVKGAYKGRLNYSSNADEEIYALRRIKFSDFNQNYIGKITLSRYP